VTKVITTKGYFISAAMAVPATQMDENEARCSRVWYTLDYAHWSKSGVSVVLRACKAACSGTS
jgi:hypothetical protein